MKVVGRTSHVTFLFFLFVSAVSTLIAQAPPRIKIWHPSPSGTSRGSDAASPDGLQNKNEQNRAPRSQGGYFIEVDTSTTITLPSIVVSTNADTGVGSFRWAIDSANAHTGLDHINFNIGGGGTQTITLGETGLPEITSPVVIDGTTQPGFAGDPMIELNGTNVTSFYAGLKIWSGSSTIRGLILNRFQSNAIVLTTLGGNVLELNFVGTNMDGTDSLPNWGNGVVMDNSPNNRIGDSLSTARNVISSNQYPNIAISGAGATGNRVVGNYIGTDKDGLKDLHNYYPNSVGVLIELGAANNIIGGLRPGERNLISGHGEGNLWLEDAGTSFNVIQGNYIGTNFIASAPLYNGRGIVIHQGSSNNLIGHTTLAGRNIISGGVDNYPGIIIEDPATSGNVVQGNIIGAPPNSTYFFGYYDGVFILNSPNNTIGGTTLGAANWISGNARNGIVIAGGQATNNHIEGNLIGNPFIPGGPSLLGNAGSGIFIDDAPNNVIGGNDPFARNTISANAKHGIVIRGDTATGNKVQGNYIGGQVNGVPGKSDFGNLGHGILLLASNNIVGGNNVDEGNIIPFNKESGVFDSTGNKNFIRYNSIYLNDSMGIDLWPRGLTPNDSLDADAGANNLQNFPILDSASVAAGSIHISGRLNSTPSTTYTLDFFSNELRDLTLFGEGETWIGTADVSTNGAGRAVIDVTFPVGVQESHFITAIATDPSGNSSEFSRGLCMQDTDGDGILDCWESRGEGIDWNADGVIDLDLFARGATPTHKDIFVEVDYMNMRKPDNSVFPMVSSAFGGVSNALVHNPDGNDGIVLHVDFGTADALTLDLWSSNPWPEFLVARQTFFGTAAERSNPSLLEAKSLVYRYCIFANAFRSSVSGAAHVIPGNPGRDFFVSLGGWGETRRNDPRIQAGTFMHELGHTLGLTHGGNDTATYKPNYYSVMNYSWQVPQSVPGQDALSWGLVYSPTELAALDENNLFESLGLLGVSPNVYPVVKVPYSRPGGSYALALLKANTAVDWDGNGDSTGFASVPVDVNLLNPFDTTKSPGQTLTGYADWPNLVYNFRNTAVAPGAFSREQVIDTLDHHELTEEMYDHLLTLPPYGVVSPLVSWSSDPTMNIRISTAPVTQSSPRIAGDGEGGAYIGWTHGSGDPLTSGVYSQRLDALGALKWVNNGTPVGVGPESQGMGDFIADGTGMAISVWHERRTVSFDIMAQKTNRFGQPQWGDSGVSIATVLFDPAYTWIRIKSDSRGGAIVVWTDAHTGTRSVYVQRIDDAGVVQWTSGGVLINTTPYNSDDFQIVSDGYGGIVIAWTDKRNGATGDIYAQRVDASGVVRWTTNGVALSTASGHQAAPALANNAAGGAIVTWVNYRSGGNDVYAQHVDSSGQVHWATNGIAVVSMAGSKSYLDIVNDGLQGAIISWLDGRRTGYTDPYVQHIDSAGFSMWATDGIAICDTLGSKESTIISDDNRGAIVVFVRRVFQSNDVHIFAQRVDSTGSMLWARNGVPIALAGGASTTEARGSVHATSNLQGGAIIAWVDGRDDTLGSGARHIYAQNVTSDGGLGGEIVTGVTESRAGQIPSQVSLLQNYPNPFNPSTMIRYDLPERSRVSLKIYNVLGQEIAILVREIQEPGEHQIRFNANNLANGVYFYQLITTSVVKGATGVAVRKMLLIR